MVKLANTKVFPLPFDAKFTGIQKKRERKKKDLKTKKVVSNPVCVAKCKLIELHIKKVKEETTDW